MCTDYYPSADTEDTLGEKDTARVSIETEGKQLAPENSPWEKPKNLN